MEKKPQAFILENVRGIVSSDKGNTLKTIENILDEVGYDFEYKIMNALEYGIPQNRDRWYCIGFRKELKVSFDSKNNNIVTFKFPKKKNISFFLEDIVSKSLLSEYKSTNRAMQNIKYHLPKYTINKGIDKDRLIIANDIRPSRCSFKNNGIIPCLTAKMGTGGNNIPVIVDYERKLTEKECLALMGFPKEFIIKPRKLRSYKQIGNSVVVPIVEALANEIIKTLQKANINNV